MTPAVNLVKQKKIRYHLHRYQPDSSSDSYGIEAAKALNLGADQVFKTLITELNGDPQSLAVAIIPVSAMLDLKKFARVMGAKSAAMAQPADAQKTTGYIVGGISPLGQKRPLPTAVHRTLTEFKTVFVSAGKRGLQIELSPADLISLTRAVIDTIAKEA